MPIQYRQQSNGISAVKDSFAEIFRECQETFEQQGLSVVGQGIDDVIINAPLFETYLGKLTEQMSADQAEVFSILAESSRDAMLKESLAGITPVHSLTMPILRRFWPRLAMANVLPTEPVKSPSITLAVMVPYLVDTAGERHRLPQAFSKGDISTNSRLALKADAITVPSANVDLFAGTGASLAAKDYVDVDFYIRKVTLAGEAGGAGEAKADTDVAVSFKLDSATSTAFGAVHHAGAVVDTIFATVDRRKALLTIASTTGKVKAAFIEGYVSSEFNNRTEEITFEIERRNIDISSGEPLAASITTQTVMDANAMYNVDTHMQLTNLASNVLAHKHDIEAMNYVARAHEDNALSGSEFGQYKAKFDVHPPVQFAGQPSEWREELKRVIDHVVEQMKTDYSLFHGETRIYGHSLDVNLIHNANWIFQGVAGDENAGVSVDYSVGRYSTGSGQVQVVSAGNVPRSQRGRLMAVFVPADEQAVTFKYLPYAYTIEQGNGYRNPNSPNVPGFVMNRRDTFFTELPMVAEIQLLNNDGTLVGAQA